MDTPVAVALVACVPISITIGKKKIALQRDAQILGRDIVAPIPLFLQR